MKERLMKDLKMSEEEITDMFDQFKKNEQLKDLEIDTFLKYMMAVEILRDSKEPQFEGYRKRLRTKPYWEIVLYPTKEQLSKDRRKQLLKIVGEDSRDFKANFKDFDLTTNKRKRAFQNAKRIVEDTITKYKENIEKIVPGMYMFSREFQIGKTYLANAIANELADVGISGAFVFVPNLALQAKDFENIHTLIKTLKQAQILVLDDLGAEYRSEWFRLEVLMPVLQYRLSTKLLTIITSNYSIQDLKKLYLTNTTAVDVNRLMSRILELTIEIEMDG